MTSKGASSGCSRQRFSRLRSHSTIDVGPRGVIQLINPDGFLLFRQQALGRRADCHQTS
jgi:hypothetical protein